MSTGYVGVSCQHLSITAYALENYSNFKNKFLSNNGSIVEINDYFNKGNLSFTELSEIITTLSNQDFAGWINLDYWKRKINVSIAKVLLSNDALLELDNELSKQNLS